MAAPRERTENGYGYEESGGGGYGKFRRRPQRRSHATPYDRPPAALRNVASPGGGGGSGWLSKIVDPAQRLITSSAHRLFASVFRKRLTPAPPSPPQLPVIEPNQGAQIDGNEAVVTNKRTAIIQNSVTTRSENPSDISEGGGISELEQLLKQQTFTRSEIDRLTTLLQSRLIDQTVGHLGDKPEMMKSSATLSSEGKESPFMPLVRESAQVERNVVPEEVSNPAELAKAYMGGGPCKVSPSKMGLHGPPLGENSTATTPFPQKRPNSVFVSSSTGQAAYTRNGFVTPRSLGRSAIYSMARTPYSRGVSVSTLQAAGTPVDSHGGRSSSSQDTWRLDRSSGLRQGTLKRRSSVFENDIAAVGPVRRIRQKSNLLPASGILSVRETGLDVQSPQQKSLKGKAVLTDEPSTENGEDENHGPAFNSIPSKSSQMASKILQQLNTLVSTPAKSPSKLSPSMLRGPALRSMDNVDSSKFLELVQDGSRLAVQSDTSSPVPRDSISQMDTVEENGRVKSFVSRKDSASSGKDVASNWLKNDVRVVEPATFSVSKSAPENPKPKKRAFQMNAHEELDEGESSNAPSFMFANGIEKSGAGLVENKMNASERMERLPTFESIQKIAGTSDGPGPEKSSGSMPSSAPVSSATIPQDVLDKPSTEASVKDSGAGPSFFAARGSIASLKEPTEMSSVFKAADKVPSFSFTSSPSLVYNSSSTISENPSRFDSLAVPNHVMDSMKKETDSKSMAKDALSMPPANFSASASSAIPSFSFGGSAAGSSLSNGSPAPPPPLFSFNHGGSSVTTASSTADVTTSNSLPVLVSAPSSTATPYFKFDTPSASSSSTLSQSATAVPVSAETKANGGSFSSTVSVSFGGTSTSFAGTEGNIFGSTPFAVSGTSGLYGGTSTISSTIVSTPANASSGSAIVSFGSGATALASSNHSQAVNLFTVNTSQSSAPGTSVTNTVESASVPYQFGSSAPSSTAFGLAGNVGFSSGSSLVTSSASDNKVFGSSGIFGLAPSAPSAEANTHSSTGNATSSLFGSSWQTSKSTSLSGASNTSSSATFVFGTGVTSNSAPSSTPVLFGSSTSASPGFPFPFSSSAAATLSQPVFGNPGSFGVGASPSANTDHMSMEDSMTEDTVQATPPAAPLFGQQPMKNGITYGSGTPAVNPFGSTAPGGASTFQFGGQLTMAAQPNSSPFQASGSLEFNGGSFSLGANGGDKSTRRIVRVKKTQRKR